MTKITLTLSADLMTQISRVVSFDDENDIAPFVENAIRSYLVLGSVRSSGGSIYAQHPDWDKDKIIKFPFEADRVVEFMAPNTTEAS